LKNESFLNLPQALLDVKFFAEQDFGVEECRPPHCTRCGVAAGSLGALRIHGHGCRRRDVWGPPNGCEGTLPTIVELVLRRYRCLECSHVMTIRPPFVARYFRYATAAIALAFLLWSVLGHAAGKVRREVSPWLVRGVSEPHRWRSLGRWLGHLEDLFRLPNRLDDEGRGLARRVTGLVGSRAPPDLPARVRTFVGAQLR